MTWLRWIVVCRFGRRCANPEAYAINAPDVHHGLILVTAWQCEGCGRTYTKKVPL